MAKKLKTAGPAPARERPTATASTATADSRYIEPLWDQLVPSQSVNARGGDHSEDGIAELAALIASQGLIQPLLVRSTPSAGIYDVVDGERRRQAIGVLIRDGTWPAERPVPCIVRNGDDAAALETSLVANISREPMHPVRELEVFAELHGAGADVATIAHRYGISARVVKQRLALGGLAPKIREAWREGKIDADDAKAFATCRDRKRQEQMFDQLAKANKLQGWQIKQALRSSNPPLNDVRVDLVGIDAYKAAGGHVVESLFADDGYLEDEALLDRLVAEKVQAKCADLVADGWSFAIPDDEAPGHWSWQRVRVEPKYTAEEKTRLKEIEAAESDPDTKWSQDLEDEAADIEDAATLRAFTAKQKRGSGCIVEVGEGLQVEYGLMRPTYDGSGLSKQERAARDARMADGDDGEAEPAGEENQEEDDAGDGRISNALMLTITERQTVAAAKVVAQSPFVAQRLLIAALHSMTPRPVKIGVEAFPEVRVGVETDHHFRTRLAETAQHGIAELSADVARLMASTLDLRIYDARNTITGSYHGADPENHRALIDALPGDLYLAEMRAELDAADYFRRAPAAVIRAAIAEMTDGKRQLGDKVKKSDLVAIAGALAGPAGWLPPELRHPDYRLLLDDDRTAAPAPVRKRKARAA